MIKHRPPSAKSQSPSGAPTGRSDRRHEAAPPPDLISRHLPSPAAIRETIESIVIAFVLAFLFRTFEAEAFVIPTGSMAPTLMGRHKDVVCPKCGCPYQVSASEEVDEAGNWKGSGISRSRPAPARCAATRRNLAPTIRSIRAIPPTTAIAFW